MHIVDSPQESDRHGLCLSKSRNEDRALLFEARNPRVSPRCVPDQCSKSWTSAVIHRNTDVFKSERGVSLPSVRCVRERRRLPEPLLIGECHAQEPRVPVVVVTGSADITQERLRDADAVLPKPFELDELLATVRNLAEAASPGSRR